MAPPARVLLVDDDPDFCEALSDRLRALGFHVSVADRGPEALRLCREEPPAIVLLDLVLPGMDGMAVLETIRREEPDVLVIVITGHGTIARAVEAMKKGAYDFVSKPVDPRHLEIVLGKAAERQALRDANALLSSEVSDRYGAIVGDSPQMRGVMDVARRAAPSGATVLLLGESGTGKEVIARAIHRWSRRGDQPFVVVNCVALGEELLESELFGHEKGAFTGAHQQKRGKLEVAHGGTVFLDEIGDVRPALQAKLLRVLQDQTFERVGGTRPMQTDVRFVAATNRDLRAAVRDGLFRLDLYYRLDVVSVTLPAASRAGGGRPRARPALPRPLPAGAEARAPQHHARGAVGAPPVRLAGERPGARERDRARRRPRRRARGHAAGPARRDPGGRAHGRPEPGGDADVSRGRGGVQARADRVDPPPDQREPHAGGAHPGAPADVSRPPDPRPRPGGPSAGSGRPGRDRRVTSARARGSGVSAARARFETWRPARRLLHSRQPRCTSPP